MSKHIRNYQKIPQDKRWREREREREKKSTQASWSSSICWDWSGFSCLPLSRLAAPGLGDTWSGFWGDRTCFSPDFFSEVGGTTVGLAFDLAEVFLASLIWSSDAWSENTLHHWCMSKIVWTHMHNIRKCKYDTENKNRPCNLAEGLVGSQLPWHQHVT